MIRILAAKIEALPDVAEMRKSLPEGWLAAFDAVHKTARRESLGGLWLLWRAGFRGRLSYDDSGRPRFLGDGVGDLSLSHTGDLVVCAVASGEHGRVGIDAEDGARLNGDAMGNIAKRFFTPDEAAEVAAAGEGAKEVFLRLWTRREAYAKFCGDGLPRHLKEEIPDGEVFFAEGKIAGVFVTLCADAPLSDALFAPDFVTFFGKDG